MQVRRELPLRQRFLYLDQLQSLPWGLLRFRVLLQQAHFAVAAQLRDPELLHGREHVGLALDLVVVCVSVVLRVPFVDASGLRAKGMVRYFSLVLSFDGLVHILADLQFAFLAEERWAFLAPDQDLISAFAL